jgi:hypothetical protein
MRREGGIRFRGFVKEGKIIRGGVVDKFVGMGEKFDVY